MPTHYKGSSKNKRSLEAVLAIKRCASSFALAHTHFLKDHLLGLPQFEILDALYHLGQLKPMDLAKKLHSSPASITYLVNRLVKQGLIDRSSSEKDKRSFELVLSTAGREKMQKIIEDFSQLNTDLVSVLELQDLQMLTDLAKRLGRHVQESKTNKISV